MHFFDNLAVVPIVFFAIIFLFASIHCQIGEEFKSNGKMQKFYPSAKFGAIPNENSLKRVKLLGNQLLLRHKFIEPLRQTMKKGQRKRRETRGKSERETDGCYRREKRRRRRRRQMGCPCIGCADCGNNRCNEQRVQREKMPPITQPQNAIASAPILPLNLYKIPQQFVGFSMGTNEYLKHQTAAKGLYPMGASSKAEQSAPYQFQSQHSLSFSAAVPTINRQHATTVHRPHGTSEYAKIPQIARKYPLPECYTDESSFMCCNAQLEETIHQAFQHLIDTIQSFHKCNIQKISNTVQSFAEKRFNISFEVVTGLTDYASKSHFYDNYICKVQRDDRYILAYATPRWEIDENKKEDKNHQIVI